MLPVVISGGSGTRLWPVSRSAYPKQFCEFYDKSFLRNSVERLLPLGAPTILTTESMRALTLRLLDELNISRDGLMCEPMGKNTAPAIALLCHLLKGRGKSEEVVGVFPADHLVMDEEAFLKVVRVGEQWATKGQVVTLGIVPRSPDTGYGYIKVSQQLLNGKTETPVHRVEEFCEKPNLELARQYVESGNYLWNSGMFIFKVSTMIAHFQEFMPELWTKISQIKADLSNAKLIYANLENISIDYGIMEKIKELACIPCQIGWSDVGSWDELARLSEEWPEFRADSKATLFSQNSANNYVYSVKPKVVGLIGTHNLIVVDTPDALLISQKGQSQKVKEIVSEIKQAGLPAATEHSFEIRPWGRFEVLSDAESFKVKRIVVDPGAQLSYQSHERRAEHWVIVAGQAEVQLDGQRQEFKAGDYIKIPTRAKHRIKNIGNEELVFVEVQTGEYFGEDDIVRYQDDYERT